ncbi:hypothetical protein FOL46_008720 [Perkinsus olseni]|uniref:E3 ubiquitin-protein ligase n=1 Tax=Perkinsus olseni TaxID=32597 RepID=A0A7J6MMP1_PEROL|nr:hypothetical protein FOL46_008720 [Perkinsus olseni]
MQGSMIKALHKGLGRPEWMEEQLITMYEAFINAPASMLDKSSEDAADPQAQRLQHYLDTVLYSLAPVSGGECSGASKDKCSDLIDAATKWCESLPSSKGAKCRCDSVWYVADGRETIAYGCKTCGLSSASCICVACFDEGDHEGHDFFISRSDYGCCDCGDAYAWKPQGFCRRHTGPLPDVDPADGLPTLTRSILTSAIGVVCGILLEMVHETMTVKDSLKAGTPNLPPFDIRARLPLLDEQISIILQWMMDLSTLHDGLRRCTAKAILQSPALRLDKATNRSAGLGSEDPSAAAEIQRHSELGDFTCQMFTRKDVTVMLATEYDVLGTILRTARDMLMRAVIQEEGTGGMYRGVDVRHAVIKKHELTQCTMDLLYVLDHDEVHEVIMRDDGKIMKEIVMPGWCEMLKLAQYCYAHRVQRGAHVEFSDPEWTGALSLHNDAVSHSWLIVDIIYHYGSAQLCGDLLLQVREALIDWETRLAPGVGAIGALSSAESTLPSPFTWSEGRDLLPKMVAASRRWDSGKDLCSMHVSLSRLYVALYTLTIHKFGLSCVPAQLRDDDDFEIVRLLEFPLRALVQHEEVCSGLWIRNGDAVRSEHEFYVANYFHHAFADLDLLAVLLTSKLCHDSGRFIKHLLSAFGIRPTVAWCEYIPPMSSSSVEEGERYVKKLCCVVKILCALVSPYASGTTDSDGKQYTEVTSRQHLRQRLAAAGQLTMSYARDPRLDKFTNTLAVADAELLQENLASVAKTEMEDTRNTAGQRSSYTLREDQWGLVDLLHPTWVWREQQDVEERLIAHLKRERRTLTEWWFEDVIYNHERAKVHKDLRDQSLRLVRAPEFLAICFIGLLAVKVGLFDTLGGDQRLLHLILHLLLRLITVSLGVEEVQESQDEQVECVEDEAEASLFSQGGGTDARFDGVLVLPQSSTSSYKFQAFTVPQLASRFHAVRAESATDTSESILSMLGSLAVKPSCAQEYPWIELLLNALHRRAVRGKDEGIKDKIEQCMKSANIPVPEVAVNPSTPARKKSTTIAADEERDGSSDAERNKRHRGDSSFSGSSPIDPGKIRRRRLVQRRMMSLVRSRQQEFLDSISRRSPSVSTAMQRQRATSTSGCDADTCVICFGGNPEPLGHIGILPESPTAVSGSLGRLCFVEAEDIAREASLFSYTDIPRPKIPAHEAILPFEETTMASPRRRSSGGAEQQSHQQQQPSMTFFSPGPTSVKAVAVLSRFGFGIAGYWLMGVWTHIAAAQHKDSQIARVQATVMASVDIKDILEYCNRPCNALLPPAEDRGLKEPPLATTFEGCPTSAARFGLECMQSLVEVLPALQGGMDASQWEKFHFGEHISPRYVDTVRGVCFVLAGAIEAYTREVVTAESSPLTPNRTWAWLLDGLVHSARALTDGPKREYLRLICAQMWTGSTCRPYAALSPSYRWFALVMSLLIDGDTEEKMKFYIIRALLHESAAPIRQVTHEMCGQDAALPRDLLAAPSVMEELAAVGTCDVLLKVVCLLHVLGISDTTLPPSSERYCASYFSVLLSKLPQGIKEAFEKARDEFEFEGIDYDSEVTREAQDLKKDLHTAVISNHACIARSLRAGMVTQCSSSLVYLTVPRVTQSQDPNIVSMPKKAFERLVAHDFVLRLSSEEQWEDYMQVHKIPACVTVLGPFEFEGDVYTVEAVPYRAGAVLVDWPKVYQRMYLCCNSDCCRLTMRGADPSGPTDSPPDLVVPDGISQKMGEVSAHALRCGLGTCVFLQLGNSVVHIISSGAKRIALWGSLHLDAFGEEDYTQSKPIRLDLATRLPRLAEAIRDHNFLWEHGKLEWKQIVFSQGPPPPSQPVGQPPPDVYYMPRGPVHASWQHPVYPSAMHWGPNMMSHGQPSHTFGLQQQPNLAEDAEMSKLKAALEGGGLRSTTGKNAAVGVSNRLSIAIGHGNRSDGGHPSIVDTGVPQDLSQVDESTTEAPPPAVAAPPAGGGGGRRKAGGGAVKFDPDHMLSSPAPIELLGGKVTCYSIISTLDGTQYFRCALCMKLQLFKSADSLLRHQATQACKTASKAAKDSKAPSDLPATKCSAAAAAAAAADGDDGAHSSSPGGGAAEASRAGRKDEVTDAAEFSPLAKPVFSRESTPPSPPSNQLAPLPARGGPSEKTAGDTDKFLNNRVAWEATTAPSELDELKVSLAHADEEEICEVFRELTGEQAPSGYSRSHLAGVLLDRLSANDTQAHQQLSRLYSFRRPASPCPILPFSCREESSVPPSPKACAPGGGLPSPIVETAKNQGTPPLDDVKRIAVTLSTAKPDAGHLAERGKMEHTSTTVDVVSASPLRQFVELRAQQIRQRFGNSFTENEVTDVLLLEWLRRQSPPPSPRPFEVEPGHHDPGACETSPKPHTTLGNPSNCGSTHEPVTAHDPTQKEYPASGSAQKPHRKSTEKREMDSEGVHGRRAKVSKKEPKRTAKKRRRSTHQSAGFGEKSVNEIALAWNKTFDQVEAAGDSAGRSKRRPRRGASALCEKCQERTALTTVKCCNCLKHWHKSCHDPGLDEEVDFTRMEWVCWPCQKKWLAGRKVCYRVGEDIWSATIRKTMWWPCRVVGLQCRHPYDPYIYCVQPYGRPGAGKAATYSASDVSPSLLGTEEPDVAVTLSRNGKPINGRSLKEILSVRA